MARLLLLLGPGIAAASVPRAGPMPRAQRFLKEYPPASRKLQDYYRHIKLYFTRVEVSRGTSVDYELFRNGDAIRWVEIDGKSKGEPYYAKMVDRDFIFRLKRDTQSGPYIVLDLGKASPSEYKGWASVTLSNAELAYAPYGARLTSPIDELLSAGALKVLDAHEAPDGSVEIEWETFQPAMRRAKGRFTFMPEQCWAVRDFVIRYIDKKHRVTKQPLPDETSWGHLEYAGLDGGVPVVKKLDTWARWGDLEMHVHTYQVMDISHEIVPREQFELRSFGVPTRPAPRAAPVWQYLLGLSAVCALAVLVVRYVRSRS